MERSTACPFAPPPEVLELAAQSGLSRVRIWDGSTPWLITGYEEARALFADSRVSVDDRRPGFPHWNEGMLATRAQAATVGVHLRRRRAHAVSADAVQAVHVQAGGGPAPGDPEDHRRAHRRDPGRSAAGGNRRGIGAAGAFAGDQRNARRAIRRRRVLPGARHHRPGPPRHRRGHREGRDGAGQVPGQPRQNQDGESGRGRGVRSGRARQRRRAQCAGGGSVGLPGC